MRRLLADTAIIIVLGALLGLTSNQARKSGHIRPFKNAFDKTLRTDVAPPQAPISAAAPADTPAVAPVVRPPAADGNEAKTAETKDAQTKAAHLEHRFQEIAFDEVEAAYSDSAAADGATVFIDARSASLFAKGHVPGALHCRPAEAGSAMEQALSRVESAAKVVVYCGGGDCEDSIFMCRELIEDFDVPYNKVFLFAGGWKEWTANGMPVEDDPNAEEESP